MLAILATANPWVRKRNYEIFYISHVGLVALVLIAGSCAPTPALPRKS